MRRLGLALHVTPSRNIISKADQTPRIGEAVVDETLKPIGRVFDIFGPVSSPYVAVKPMKVEPKTLVGKRLYVLPSKRRKERETYE